MKKTLSTSEIVDFLMADDYANWSRAGAYALADYLEQLEEGSGIEIELDVVALRCDYSEYDSLQDWFTEYYGRDLKTSSGHAGIDLEGDEGDEEIDALIENHIEDHGQLIKSATTSSVIVSSF